MIVLFEKVERYLKTIEAFDGAAMGELLQRDFEQTEFPNALNPLGQQSNRADCLRRLETARQILTRQRFEVTNHCESGDQVFVEAVWSGQMAVDAGPLKKGQELTAHFCIAFEFKDDLLFRQRNYNCFERL